MRLKRVLSLFILCLLSGILFAQEAKQTAYPFNQLRVSVTPSLCSSLDIKHAGGADIFKSNPTLGAEATISYYQRIVKQFGVSLGFGINSTAYAHSYSFIPRIASEVPEYQEGIKDKWYEPTKMITIPLALSMKIPTKSPSWNIDIQAGTRFNFLYEVGETIRVSWWGETDGIIQDLDFYKKNSPYLIESKIDKPFLFSYFLKAGATYTTKRNNGYFCNIIVHYAPKEALTGSYLFRATGGDSYGSFKQNLNYLGLEVGYAFTLCKKR